jgi:hypothetical protein
MKYQLYSYKIIKKKRKMQLKKKSFFFLGYWGWATTPRGLCVDEDVAQEAMAFLSKCDIV